MAVVVTVPSLFPRVHHLHPLPACGSVLLLSESPSGVPPAGRALSQPRRPAPLEDPSPPRRSSISYSQQAAVQTGKRPRACRGKLPCSHLSPSLLFQAPLGFFFLRGGVESRIPFLEQNVSGSVATKVYSTPVSASGRQGKALLTCFHLCGLSNLLRNCCIIWGGRWPIQLCRCCEKPGGQPYSVPLRTGWTDSVFGAHSEQDHARAETQQIKGLQAEAPGLVAKLVWRQSRGGWHCGVGTGR